MNILVIAPHADDEILGCGGTIARLSGEGHTVFVLIATNAAIGAPELFNQEGVMNIRREAKEAHNILGVKETFYLDFPAPALNAYPEYKISLGITQILSQVAPQQLFLPHPSDLHQDHKAIYRASLVAARPQNDCTVKGIYCYETLSETEWAPVVANNFFIPNYFIGIAEYFEKKVEAMNCFKSQLKKFPHSRSIEALSALAKYRGATIGVSAAEAFSVERQVI